MSREERDARIGRLMRELAEANKELALVREALREYQALFSELARLASPSATPENAEAAVRLIAELEHREALLRTAEYLGDLARLPRRIDV